jgi:uncharacterized protein
MHWHTTLEDKKPTLNKPIFIEGLPGIGNVGKIAADFLIEELKAKKLFSFFSHRFPHSVFVNENNLIDMPKIEIYYKKYSKNSKKKDVLILTGDIQPIDEESCYTFCEVLLNIIKEFKCSQIITTGGIGLQSMPEHPKVYCASNDEKLYKSFTKKGSGIQKNIFGVVGPIIGVSGILLALSKKDNLKGVALLAETFAHPMYLGIKGAKELLKVIDTRFNFKINIKKMSKEIVEAEKELMSKTKEWLSEASSHPQAGAKPKNPEINYIG